MRAKPLSVSPPSLLPNSPEIQKIARKWELFVTGKEVDLSDVPPVVRQGWMRSRQARVDPALPHAPWGEVPTDPEMLREEIGWLCCAEPVLSFLRSVLTEPHQVIFLVDHQGQILLSYGGHKAKSRAEEIRAVPGGRWSEREVGCTVLGTSLYTGTSVQICWQENYCINWQDWMSHGVPIYNPATGEILGAVGIAGWRELSHPGALELVIKAAEMIEAGVREQETRARLSVLEHLTRLIIRYPSEGLLAIDKRGCILALSPAAEKILSLPHSRLIGRRVQDLPALREHVGQRAAAMPAESVLGQEHLPGAMVFPVSANRTTGAVVLLPQTARPFAREHPQQPWATTCTFSDLAGQSPRFRECLDFAYKASQHDCPVLLLGETGTGKELFAQAIHSASPRRRGPFVTFNCASVSDELIGTELFGYTEGTFTGSLKGGKLGKVQLAHKGTLFLDDVDSMPPKMQVSLLRVLEEGQVVPLGAQKPQSVDVRVIAASNSDLEQMVSERKFRHDFYHRLNVLSVKLPPLRERAEDVPLLARHILSYNAPSITTITEEALCMLTSYSWPGNVRELRNVLLQAAILTQKGLITSSDLPSAITRSATPATEVSTPHLQSLKEAGKQAEAELIVRAIQQTGSVPQAASLLGLHYSTLYRKLKSCRIGLPSARKKSHEDV